VGEVLEAMGDHVGAHLPFLEAAELHGLSIASVTAVVAQVHAQSSLEQLRRRHPEEPHEVLQGELAGRLDRRWRQGLDAEWRVLATSRLGRIVKASCGVTERLGTLSPRASEAEQARVAALGEVSRAERLHGVADHETGLDGRESVLGPRG